MVKLLSIEEAGPTFIVWVEQDDSYIYYHATHKGFIEKERHSVKEYRGYEHFAGVVGKFNPYTVFLKNPIEINLSYKDLQKTYKTIPK